MASSSRASTSSASSLPLSSYDVFINFRGVDTRRNFVSLLYDALGRAGINVFRDSDELGEGETIPSSLLRAIRGSKISIPVFSKRYADSKYCLLELTEIWECHVSNGQIVLPIFIDVEPRDVRHQSGSFQAPFEEHQTNCESAIVEVWKNALTEVGNLKGWTFKGDANIEEQSNIVDLVVQKALRELDSTPLDEQKHLIGIDSHLDELLRLLHIGSDDVQFVGICGMGGLGKTTMAKVVYNRIFRKFDGSSFLKDVREEASQGDKGVVSLQKQLLRDIFKRDYDISIVPRGSKLIAERLHRKKILLILDDVDDYEQLNALAGGLNWFGQGSKVIITTRDEHILNVHKKKVGKDIQIYMPEELNPENSLHLFSLHAFSDKEPPENYKQLSFEVVRYVGGLPLTLEVLGSFLTDKNKEEWEDTLERLKDTKSIRNYDDKVFAKLMISYNKLGDPEKTIFLDIACNFNHWKKETPISIWEACKLHPRLAIKELNQKHLLKIDDEYGTLWMHDQLQYMGRRIVSKDCSDDPTKQSRLWSQDDILKVLKRDMGIQKMVEGILINDEFKFEGDDVLRYEDFEKMPNLRFLRVFENNLNGDFLCLPSALKWFYWGGYDLESTVPANFYHEELLHLELYKRSLELAWNDTPQNKKKFQKLKVLILNNCRELSVSPNFFSWFPCLQSLEISSSSSPFELPDGICHMWPFLKSLVLHSCESFYKLPRTIGDLKHLVKLSVVGTEIEEIPDGVGQLEKLEELDVSYCSKLRKLVKLPTSMSRMRSLRHVNLAGTAIAKLPDDFSKLSSLEVFHMPRSLSEVEQSTCYMGLQPVPINVSVFSQLQVLCLSDYPTSLESLPELPLILTTLRVNFCHSLKMTPDLSHLERLKELSIYSCDRLEHLERLPSNLINLTCRECESLVRLPNLSNLKSLKKLELNCCENVEEIDGLEGTKSLEDFNVRSCYKITETTRKILGEGMLKDNFGEGQGSKLIADDEVHNGSPILCVVFDVSPAEEMEDCVVIIDACIRRGEKRTNCHHEIRIGDIQLRNYGNIIYIHHLKGFDWFGFPLESKDAIEKLTALMEYSDGCVPFYYTNAEFVKVLFENKESDQQMPDQQSAAMLVADFFKFDDDDYDDEYSDEDDQDDDKSDEDDPNDGECDKEEMLRPKKRAHLDNDDEASDFSLSLTSSTPPSLVSFPWAWHRGPGKEKLNNGFNLQQF